MRINGKRYGVRFFKLSKTGDGKDNFRIKIPSTLTEEQCESEIDKMKKFQKKTRGVYVTLVNIVDDGNVVSQGMMSCSRKEKGGPSRWLGQRRALVRALRNMDNVDRAARCEIFSYIDSKAEHDRSVSAKKLAEVKSSKKIPTQIEA